MTQLGMWPHRHFLAKQIGIFVVTRTERRAKIVVPPKKLNKNEDKTMTTCK